MGDDVEFYFLADDFHHAQVVGGDRQDDDAVVVVVGLLHGSQVGLNLVVHLRGGVGQKDGALNGRAPHALQVFEDEGAHLVALDVVHDEEYHVVGYFLVLVDDAEYLAKSHLQGIQLPDGLGARSCGGKLCTFELRQLLSQRQRRFGFAWHGAVLLLVDKLLDDHGSGLVERGVRARARRLHHGKSPFAKEEIDLGLLQSHRHAYLLAILDVAYLGDGDLERLDESTQLVDDFVEHIGHIHGAFRPCGAALLSEPLAYLLEYVGGRFGRVVFFFSLLCLPGLLVGRTLEVEGLLHIGLGVDEVLHLDGLGLGIVVGHGVAAEEAGSRHVASARIDDLLELVLPGEAGEEEFVEHLVEARVIASLGEPEHHFQSVAARRNEAEQRSGVGIDLLPERVEHEVFLGNVVDVDDEILGIGEVVRPPLGRIEHGADEERQLRLEQCVGFGVYGARRPQLSQQQGGLLSRVAERVVEVLHGHLDQRIGGALDVFSSGNHGLTR